MARRSALLLIAIALAAYGLDRALYAATMWPGPASLPLWLAFSLQAVLALLAALAVWRRSRLAAPALLLLGAAIAATALLEAFVLGVRAWLPASAIAVAAIGIAVFLGAYVRPAGPPGPEAG